MSQGEKRKFLSRLIEENFSQSRQSFSYKGISLCTLCCLTLFNVTEKEWNKLQKKKPGLLLRRQRRKPKEEIAEAWLRNFLDHAGQHSPCPTNKIYVQGYTARMIHREMVQQLTSKGWDPKKILQYTSFTLLLKKLRISLGKPNAFLGCNACSELKNSRNSAKDAKDKKLAVDLLTEHLRIANYQEDHPHNPGDEICRFYGLLHLRRRERREAASDFATGSARVLFTTQVAPASL
ncbi:unnamed protein product, partial [Darwinula stevensoni]